MSPVFVYFATIWSLVGIAVIAFHIKTMGSMTLSTLSPLPLPAGTTRMVRRRSR